MAVEKNIRYPLYSSEGYIPLDSRNSLDKELLTALDHINSGRSAMANELLEKIFNDAQLIDDITSFRWQYIATIAMSVGKLELAKTSYVRSGNLSGAAFVCILQNQCDEAKIILSNAAMSPVSSWCLFLLELIEGNMIKNWPSFLQIRHFMELTTYYSLVVKNYYLIDLLKSVVSKLMEINIDALKLMGYGYYHFGLVDKAIEILSNAAQANQFDGEIYFFLGQIYYEKDDYNNSMSMLENAKMFMPNHYPTKALREKVDSLI